MKPSELSIGDWVCAAGPVINGEERQTPPMRVISIGETWVNLMIDPEQGDPRHIVGQWVALDTV